MGESKFDPRTIREFVASLNVGATSDPTVIDLADECLTACDEIDRYRAALADSYRHMQDSPNLEWVEDENADLAFECYTEALAARRAARTE